MVRVKFSNAFGPSSHSTLRRVRSSDFIPFADQLESVRLALFILAGRSRVSR